MSGVLSLAIGGLHTNALEHSHFVWWHLAFHLMIYHVVHKLPMSMNDL
jgi:hypothetical protein